MSGGKGGSTTSEITVPDYIEDAARRNLAKADEYLELDLHHIMAQMLQHLIQCNRRRFKIRLMCKCIWYGYADKPTDIMGNMGAPQTYANGVTGYSSAPMFQDSVDTLRLFKTSSGWFNR